MFFGMEEFPEDPVIQFMILDGWRESPVDIDQEDDYSTQDSQANTLSSSSETYLIGFVLANIVGVRYYSGTISGREMVGLVREPLNPYDENAIRVFNTRSVQVGHIERSVASVLSPLIDENMISIEGIVPNAGGRGNARFRIPCQIHIFVRIEARERVQSAISRGGLHLISELDPGFTLSEAIAVKDKKAVVDERNFEEIFKLVDENVNKKGAWAALEPPKDVIKSELFEHQKEGLGWLVHRENSSELPPFWEERDGTYVNVLTAFQTDTRPEPLRGGIFADDMGLGKTLTLLSLIAFDKYGNSISSAIGSINIDKIDGTGDEDMGGEKSKKGRTSKKASGARKKRKIDLKGKSIDVVNDSSVLCVKTTLVVCPPSVFSTWVTQLEEHTRRGSLKVYLFYGERTKEAEVLQKYDIVLTTYTTLVAEDRSKDSTLKKIEWWRVILDEAHIIKNVNAQQSRAVTDLKAKRRWAVTGTPIQNGTSDLFSLMAFLRFEPFSVQNFWQRLVNRPLSQGKKEGLSRLQVLMATISLRRTKDKSLVGLPPKSIETCFVELSGEERELYDQMEGEAKTYLQDYIDTGSVMRNYSTVLGIILRLRQICTDLALCPSDLKSLLPSDIIEDVSNNPDLLKKMVSVLQDGEDFDCPICISPPTDTVITLCAHIFCRGCILKTLKRAKPCCPLCRHPLSQTDLFSAPPEYSENESTGTSKASTSSKVCALLKLLLASRDENPARKSVIFSQFRKMLILLEEPLKAAGFKFLRLDGSMNAKKRSQVIQGFGVPGADGPTILLASLKASSAGINLTVASRVYLMEPWWNPAVEEQAMDRVHRIGQKEDVKIVRLIAQNSIEERILELQEKKKKLAREAFGRKGAKDRKEVSVDELRTLMSL